MHSALNATPDLSSAVSEGSHKAQLRNPSPHAGIAVVSLRDLLNRRHAVAARMLQGKSTEFIAGQHSVLIRAGHPADFSMPYEQTSNWATASSLLAVSLASVVV